MSNRILNDETKRLVPQSVSETKTAAGDFAKGYRRAGREMCPRGSVKVEPVGEYWGVFNYNPTPGFTYITIEEGIELGKRRYGSKRRPPYREALDKAGKPWF